MNNADMPASPTDELIIWSGGTPINKKATGLTKREYFAGLALSHILDLYDPFEHGTFDSSNYEQTAKQAVALSDALLEELENATNDPTR